MAALLIWRWAWQHHWFGAEHGSIIDLVLSMTALLIWCRAWQHYWFGAEHDSIIDLVLSITASLIWCWAWQHYWFGAEHGSINDLVQSMTALKHRMLSLPGPFCLVLLFSLYFFLGFFLILLWVIWQPERCKLPLPFFLEIKPISCRVTFLAS